MTSPTAANLILNFAVDRPDALTVQANITSSGAGRFAATVNGVAEELKLGENSSISD
jgi:hypothetical protein